MKNLFIRNRKNQKISVLVEGAKNSKGLVFVMHGFSGNKNQPHIRTFIEIFKEKNFDVVSFDTTNSTGESEGNLPDATLTNYYQDLEDVIDWAKSMDFYKEPFILCGHSLGGISITLFAEKYPEKVKAIAPISSVISGELSEKSEDFKNIEKDWREKGITEWKSSSDPGVIKRLKWSYVEDRRKYNLLDNVDKLKMPVILIVGEYDNTTPLEHQEILYNNLNTKKELHIIKEAEHTFTEDKHLKEIKKILLKWIEKLC